MSRLTLPRSSGPVAKKKVLATDVRINSPGKIKFLTDTFIAPTAAVEIRATIHASVMGTAMAQVRLLVGAGDQTAAFMRDGATQYWPKATGVQEFNAGKISYNTSGSLEASFIVPDLTPGSLYTWSLDCAIVGGNDAVDDLTIANGPHHMAMHPDEGTWAVTCFDGNRVDVFPAPHSRFSVWLDRPMNTDAYYPEQLVTQTQPVGITYTPDGTKLIVCHYGSRTVQIWDVNSWTVLITTAAVGTAGQEPWDVVCVNNTHAYVSMLDGRLCRVTIADGTLTHYSPGGTSLRDMAVDRTNSLIYLAEYGADRIYKFSTATNTVTGTVNLSSGDNPYDVALTPDKSEMWVACARTGTARVRRMDTANMGLGFSEAADNAAIGAVAQHISISPDGHMAAMTAGGAVTFIGVSASSKRLGFFDQVFFGSQQADCHIDSMGNVFALNYAGDKVQVWPGADFQIRAATGGDFYHEGCVVEVIGAVE